MQYKVDDITVKIVKPKTKSSQKEDVERVAQFIYTLGQIQKNIERQEKCKQKTLKKS